MSKLEQLHILYNKYKEEFKEKEIVLGDGNIDAQLVLIGEAPGKDEVRLNKPFVGMAGKNLSGFLDVLEIERESIYITNAIKYRLSQVSPKTGRISNRPAASEEIRRSMRYLHEELSIIGSSYIVTLGNVPLKALTNDFSAIIGAVHGEIQRIVLSDREFMLFPLYHPASIIYNQSLKNVYLNDINRLKAVLKGSCSKTPTLK